MIYSEVTDKMNIRFEYRVLRNVRGQSQVKVNSKSSQSQGQFKVKSRSIQSQSQVKVNSKSSQGQIKVKSRSILS